jgi:ribose 5-phosphate isomerase
MVRLPGRARGARRGCDHRRADLDAHRRSGAQGGPPGDQRSTRRKWLDLTIDGADEFDGDAQPDQGRRRGAVAGKDRRHRLGPMIVIADASKEVETLGAFPLPVEVVPFGWQTTKALIEETLVRARCDGPRPRCG